MKRIGTFCSTQHAIDILPDTSDRNFIQLDSSKNWYIDSKEGHVVAVSSPSSTLFSDFSLTKLQVDILYMMENVARGCPWCSPPWNSRQEVFTTARDLLVYPLSAGLHVSLTISFSRQAVMQESCSLPNQMQLSLLESQSLAPLWKSLRHLLGQRIGCLPQCQWVRSVEFGQYQNGMATENSTPWI